MNRVLLTLFFLLMLVWGTDVRAQESIQGDVGWERVVRPGTHQPLVIDAGTLTGEATLVVGSTEYRFLPTDFPGSRAGQIRLVLYLERWPVNVELNGTPVTFPRVDVAAWSDRWEFLPESAPERPRREEQGEQVTWRSRGALEALIEDPWLAGAFNQVVLSEADRIAIRDHRLLGYLAEPHAVFRPFVLDPGGWPREAWPSRSRRQLAMGLVLAVLGGFFAVIVLAAPISNGKAWGGALILLGVTTALITAWMFPRPTEEMDSVRVVARLTSGEIHQNIFHYAARQSGPVQTGTFHYPLAPVDLESGWIRLKPDGWSVSGEVEAGDHWISGTFHFNPVGLPAIDREPDGVLEWDGQAFVQDEKPVGFTAAVLKAARRNCYPAVPLRVRWYEDVDGHRMSVHLDRR
jgi:hypothetical protein